MKIGIMGGTFNPIHNGHLTLASAAKSEAGLDEVWFMPSGLPAHKSNAELLPSADRLSMVQCAIEGQKGFIASSFEIDRPGFTYTADTVAALKEEYPLHTFYFIIGGDSLMKFHHWVKPEVISSHVTLLAAGRNGFSKEELLLQKKKLFQLFGTKVQFVDLQEIDISSSRIRELIKEGQISDIKTMVPAAVYQYIVDNGLYQ